ERDRPGRLHAVKNKAPGNGGPPPPLSRESYGFDRRSAFPKGVEPDFLSSRGPVQVGRFPCPEWGCGRRRKFSRPPAEVNDLESCRVLEGDPFSLRREARASDESRLPDLVQDLSDRVFETPLPVLGDMDDRQALSVRGPGRITGTRDELARGSSRERNRGECKRTRRGPEKDGEIAAGGNRRDVRRRKAQRTGFESPGSGYEELP